MSGGPHIFILAGEPSGDMIGSLLIRELRQLIPGARITGIGGDRMAEAGAEIRFNIVRDLAVIGITEPLLKAREIRALFRDTYAFLDESRPDAVVLIDYPGFNLRVARHAHGRGMKVVYYVIPQVWAWRKGRVRILRECVDRVLPILPFEKPFLEKEGVAADFPGHWLLDVMKLTMSREEVMRHFGFDPARPLIGLLPGSRRREIKVLLPVMLEAAERIAAAIPGAQFFLPKAPTVEAETIAQHMEGRRVEVKVIDSFRYNLRAAADYALVASGTATLETGLLGCPMAILYRVSALSFMILKQLALVRNVGLINLVAEEEIVPELLQDACTAENAAAHAIASLSDPARLKRTRERLLAVREKLGGPGASRRAAEIVCEVAGAALPSPGATPALS